MCPIFGVSLLHEDKALRAVRSPVEMPDALPELGLQAGRCSSRSRRRSPCDGRLLRPPVIVVHSANAAASRMEPTIEAIRRLGWVEVTLGSC
jgi:hypothetical protein